MYDIENLVGVASCVWTRKAEKGYEEMLRQPPMNNTEGIVKQPLDNELVTPQ